MDLNIFTVLLFTLFTAGHSLKCYQCSSETGSCLNDVETTCPTGNICASQISVHSVGEDQYSVQIKNCSEPKICVSGSVNYGSSRTAITTQCCNTDLCNGQSVSDSSSKDPNGKQCYYCDEESCFNKMNCLGNEDNCIKSTANVESVSMIFKGCASKSMCDLSQLVQEYGEVSCCKGNLCNSAKSISLNLLLLSCAFIFYIILH